MTALLFLLSMLAQHQWGNLVYSAPSSNVKIAPQPVVASCDPSLFAHVYHAQRLVVQNPCVSVTGTIADATHGKRKSGVRREQDGDCHAWLKLDPGQEQYLNEGNKRSEGNNLVFEIVCMYPVTQKDAIEACKGYTNKIKLFPVGSHVQMTGSWVQDTNHEKWLELHPVSSIALIDASRAKL